MRTCLHALNASNNPTIDSSALASVPLSFDRLDETVTVRQSLSADSASVGAGGRPGTSSLLPCSEPRDLSPSCSADGVCETVEGDFECVVGNPVRAGCGVAEGWLGVLYGGARRASLALLEEGAETADLRVRVWGGEGRLAGELLGGMSAVGLRRYRQALLSHPSARLLLRVSGG